MQDDKITWSDEIYRIVGLGKERYLNSSHSVYELIHPDDVPKVKEHMRAAIFEGADYEIEHRVLRPDGGIIYVKQIGEVFRNAEGKAVRMLGTAQDISDERERRRQLQLSQTIFENANEGILATNKHFQIVSVNPVMEELCGYSQDQLLQRHVSSLLPQPLRDELVVEIRDRLQTHGKWRGEAELQVSNAPSVPVMASVALIEDGDGQNDGCIFTVADISKLKVNEAQLDFLAHYDQLTRLPNRTLFLKELSKRIERAELSQRSIYLLYIDLDGFKLVNDSQGHSAGDALLFEVADQLRASVTQDSLISRLGGDEFAILSNASDEREAETMAQTVIENLQLRKDFNDFSVTISASVGIASYPRDDHEPLELIKKADQAMYEAKANGKNRFQHYNAKVGDLLRYRVKMTSDLSKALQDKQLFLYLQPKLIVNQPQAHAVEALVRWHHPEEGLVSPCDFIPIAEESGQILELGRQVLAMCANFARRWRQSSQQELSIAVNLSARQLHDKNLLKCIKKILYDAKVKPSWFEFEITESVVMDDVESSLRVFNGLKEMGARIAIDDFGTGYSSLSYLKKLPVDVLKIDRSFISPLPNSVDDLAIVTAIISMAKSLNIEVVAEGVETQGQAELLQNLGIEQLQGFLLGRPMPVKQYMLNPSLLDYCS